MMDLNTAMQNWDGLTPARQQEIFKAFCAELQRDPENYADLIRTTLEQAVGWEADDYFGTEGMRL